MFHDFFFVHTFSLFLVLCIFFLYLIFCLSSSLSLYHSYLFFFLFCSLIHADQTRDAKIRLRLDKSFASYASSYGYRDVDDDDDNDGAVVAVVAVADDLAVARFA